MVIRVAIAFFCIVLMTGCSRIPQPVGYSYSEQQKMQAAHHWEVLANDVANQVNAELVARGYLDTPVYVRHVCEEKKDCTGSSPFAFDQGFNDLLTTHLVNFGVPTRPVPADDSLEVDYKIQVIYHRSARYQWPQPGVLTALTAGIMVFRNAPFEVAAIAGAAAADALWSTEVMNGHYEVIITTSIINDNLYLMRKSDIYYINDTDFWQYQPSVPAQELQLTSSRF